MKLRLLLETLRRGLADELRARWRSRTHAQTDARTARLEPFGAIVQLIRPRALVFVDRRYARDLGLSPPADSALWSDPGDDGQVGRSVLSAPLEAHLQLTNRCDAGCKGC
ncbi:MAG: hypothetical protein AAGC55_08490, partial [Myxococcota bacterium]